MNNIYCHFFVGKLQEGVGQGFNRAVHITFDDDIKLFEFTDGNTPPDLIQGDMFLRPEALLALKLKTLGGYILGFFFVGHDIETIASLRCAVKAQHKDRSGRSCFLYGLVALIVHGFNPAIGGACKDNIADL